MSLPADQRTRSCAMELVCPDCRTAFPLAETTFRCPDCDKGLDVVYDYELAARRIAERAPAERPRNIWRYEELLPVPSTVREVANLEPGCTPLVRADNLAKALGMRALWVKDDSANPTQLTISKKWGSASDILVPGNYVGDGKTDFAFWRSGNGTWYVSDFSAANEDAVQLGKVGDIPV